MIKLLLFTFLSLFTFSAFAQEILPVLSNADFFELLIASLGGIKGASTLAIVGIVLKLILAFFNSKLAGGFGFMRKLSGSGKLLAVLAISYASGIVTLMIANDLGFGAAFIHSSSMSAFLVLTNQAYKKFIEK